MTKVVLITGSTRNTGKTIARYFGQRGYTVAINGRSSDTVVATVDELTSEGITAVPATVDITDPNAVDDLVDRLESETGEIAALIHNATLRLHRPIVELTPADWNAVVATVLTAGFVCARAVVPAMQLRRAGRLIFIGGHSAQSGASGGSATGAAKNGLFGLTKALAMELGPDGITANCISPGVIATVRAEHERAGGAEFAHLEANRQRAVERVPLGRVGRQEEVAAMAYFLCSDEAGYVTGQVINVNGGLYM